MKIRNGFVSNSSTSSFLIYNKTDKTLSLADFVMENGQKLLDDYIHKYCCSSVKDYYTFEKMLEAVVNYDYVFTPHSSTPVCFGDEHGNVLGAVFDYMLRDGKCESANFKWFMIECRGCEKYIPKDWPGEINGLSPSEAIFGFCAWLTTRKETIIFGASEDCSPIPDLIKEFCDANNLEQPRNYWERNLIHPKEK
jgi:hypothetical protein